MRTLAAVVLHAFSHGLFIDGHREMHLAVKLPKQIEQEEDLSSFSPPLTGEGQREGSVHRARLSQPEASSSGRLLPGR